MKFPPPAPVSIKSEMLLLEFECVPLARVSSRSGEDDDDDGSP